MDARVHRYVAVILIEADDVYESDKDWARYNDALMSYKGWMQARLYRKVHAA